MTLALLEGFAHFVLDEFGGVSREEIFDVGELVDGAVGTLVDLFEFIDLDQCIDIFFFLNLFAWF